MRNIVLMGAPGCGKGTQSDLIKNTLNLLKVAPGDILREYRKDPTKPFFAEINSLLDQGKLLNDDIVNHITWYFITNHLPSHNGLLLDGYPRSIGQAEFIDQKLEEMGQKIDTALLLDVSLESLVVRLTNRYMCSKCGAVYNYKTKPTKTEGICDECGSHDFITRKDDSQESIIRTRFSEFEEKTRPVLEYYKSQGKLQTIEATGEIEEVHQKVVKLLHAKG